MNQKREKDTENSVNVDQVASRFEHGKNANVVTKMKSTFKLCLFSERGKNVRMETTFERKKSAKNSDHIAY